jgi:hypothetical protein
MWEAKFHTHKKLGKIKILFYLFIFLDTILAQENITSIENHKHYAVRRKKNAWLPTAVILYYPATELY